MMGYFTVWILFGIVAGICTKSYMTVKEISQEGDRIFASIVAAFFGPLTLVALVSWMAIDNGSKWVTKEFKKL